MVSLVPFVLPPTVRMAHEGHYNNLYVVASYGIPNFYGEQKTKG